LNLDLSPNNDFYSDRHLLKKFSHLRGHFQNYWICWQSCSSY